MKPDRNEVEAYTRWIRSRETKRQLEKADEFISTEELIAQDGTLQEAARAHYIRKGGELLMTYLRNQMVIEDYDAPATDTLPDFGADAILADELMIK